MIYLPLHTSDSLSLCASICKRRESIDTALHQGQIIFVVFVIRIENTRPPKFVIMGELVAGAVSPGGGGAGMQEKEQM